VPRYQCDPTRKAVLDAIMAETARAKEAQRDGQWITYLIRDPRYPDKRGNPGTPIYVGQTNDFPGRVLSRFMKCEKEAAGKGTDCFERRVADLLHLHVVATYQVLEYQPTHLTSLISETNWARKCWNAGYDLANRAELQNAGGPPIGRADAPRSWLLKFSLAEAIADDIRVSTCDHDWSACQAVALGRMHILRHCRKAPGPRFGRMKSGEKCQDRCCLNLQPFRQGQRVIQFYPKIADGALQLGMAQEKLAGSEVPGFAIEQRDLRSPQAVTAVGGRF